MTSKGGCFIMNVLSWYSRGIACYRLVMPRCCSFVDIIQWAMKWYFITFTFRLECVALHGVAKVTGYERAAQSAKPTRKNYVRSFKAKRRRGGQMGGMNEKNDEMRVFWDKAKVTVETTIRKNVKHQLFFIHKNQKGQVQLWPWSAEQHKTYFLCFFYHGLENSQFKFEQCTTVYTF